MQRWFVVPVFLLSCLMVFLAGCSMLPSKKPAKQNQPEASAAASSTVEWKDRRWESYADERGVQYYFEKESISYPKKDTMLVWRKRIFPGKMSSHKEIVSLDEFDCREEKVRSLQVQGLNWDDTTTPIYQRPTPWAIVYTNTADDYFVLNYCRRAESVGKTSTE
jgi:hypothetical protein